MILKSVLAASLLISGTAFAQADSLPTKANLKGTWWVYVNGNKLGHVIISPGGTVKAIKTNGETDTGRWRVSPNDRYCVTFSKWGDHTEHCSNLRIDSQGVAHGDGFSARR